MSLNATKRKKNIGYLGNPKLKRVGVSESFTPAQTEEIIKCARDPIYFIENYCKIVSLDKGLILFKMYPFQKEYVRALHENRKVVCMLGRQMGKTQSTAGYLCWHAIFNEQQNIALLSYKLAGSKEVLTRIKTMYENLPSFLQLGVAEWNKTSIELENGSKIFASATSPNAVTGKSLNAVYLDEYAVVANNIAEEFNTSVWPTLSTGETTKIFASSTPRGRNHFYKLWKEAEEGVNGFKTFYANWDAVPGRDEAWLKTQEIALGPLKFSRDILCTFENSANTLISGMATSRLLMRNPIRQDEVGNTKVFEEPIEGHNYITCVDVARGTENDYSSSVTIDVSVRPYRVVHTYRDNKIATGMLANVIKNIAEYYNESYVVVEINDMGESVVNDLREELEYDNIFVTSASTISGWKKAEHYGIRTTTKTKRKGCEALKNLIETNQLEVFDINIISEISTFVAKRNSYAAEAGNHDDLVMCLVLFSWLTLQQYFTDIAGVTKNDLFNDSIKKIDEDFTLMGMKNVSKPILEVSQKELDKVDDFYKFMFNERNIVGREFYEDDDNFKVIGF